MHPIGQSCTPSSNYYSCATTCCLPDGVPKQNNVERQRITERIMRALGILVDAPDVSKAPVGRFYNNITELQPILHTCSALIAVVPARRLCAWMNQEQHEQKGPKQKCGKKQKRPCDPNIYLKNAQQREHLEEALLSSVNEPRWCALDYEEAWSPHHPHTQMVNHLSSSNQYQWAVLWLTRNPICFYLALASSTAHMMGDENTLVPWMADPLVVGLDAIRRLEGFKVRR